MHWGNPTSSASLSWRLCPTRSKVWKVSPSTPQDETGRRWSVAQLSSCWSTATSCWLTTSIFYNRKLRPDNQRRLTCCRSQSWRWPAAWVRLARPVGACRTGSGSATRWGRTSCPALSWTSRACRPAYTQARRESRFSVVDHGVKKPSVIEGQRVLNCGADFWVLRQSQYYTTNQRFWDWCLNSPISNNTVKLDTWLNEKRKFFLQYDKHFTTFFLS